MSSNPSPASGQATYDAVVIGAGFAGMYMLHRLRGLGLSVRVFERGEGVGGTWYWNRYPGARCDTESMIYSYSFSAELEQEWVWTERYAPQAEILRYANHVADRFDLRRDIQLETTVTAAIYDEAGGRWTVTTDRGDVVSARFCISAVGCLSVSVLPEIKGLADFRGERYHTGNWPHHPVAFAGKRVGIIGTGSSGIQSATAIAPEAAHLYVFQRTPNYSIPAWNGPLDPAHADAIKADYARIREDARYAQIGIPFTSNGKSAREVPADEREREYEAGWAEGGFNFVMAYPDILKDLESNRTAADFVARKIRAKVRDPKVAEMLIPDDHPLGTKRLCVDTGYYEVFNRDNVTLVDIRRAPIETITPSGLRTAEASYDLDMIIFATGFDAITGPLLRIDLRGRDGERLQDQWADGPRSYLGIGVAGFPNFFMITGPGSPCVLSNMIVSIEQHVDWIADCIAFMRAQGAETVEPAPDAEDEWGRVVHEVGHGTLYPLANSWYTGANIAGKVRTFPPYAGGVGTYRRVCDEVVEKGYEGFMFSGPRPEGSRAPADIAAMPLVAAP